MSDAEFTQVFEQFLQQLNGDELPYEHRRAVLQVFSKRLEAMRMAAKATSQDHYFQGLERSNYNTNDNMSGVDTEDMLNAELESRMDELVAAERPELTHDSSEKKQPTVESGSKSAIADDAHSIATTNARLEAANATGLSSIELAIGDKLRQHNTPHDAFIAFDQIGDGTLTPDEFQAAANSLGIYIYEDEVADIIAKYDKDGDGCLDYEEFLASVSQVDYSMLTSRDYDEALVGRPSPVPPTTFHLEPSEEEKLRQTVESIRSHVTQHWRSSRRAFLDCNRKRDSRLTVAEFARGLQRIGLHLDISVIRKLLRPYMREDSNKNYITEHEFQMFLAGEPSVTGASVAEKPPPVIPEDATPEQAIATVLTIVKESDHSFRDIFTRFDLNGDGLISPMEFRRGLLALGYNVNLPTCMEFVKAFDLNNDGHLQYFELVRMLQEFDEEEGVSPVASPIRHDIRNTTSHLGNMLGSSSMDMTSSYRDNTGTYQKSGSAYQASAYAPQSRGNYVLPGHTQSSRPPMQSSMVKSSTQPPNQTASPVAHKSELATPKLLRRVCETVYSSGMGAAKLYKNMRQFGEIGVDADDLKYGLHRIGLTISMEEAQALVDRFDEDQDGKLSMGEFLHLLSFGESPRAI